MCCSSSFPGSATWSAPSRRAASRIRQAALRGKQRSVHNTYFTLPVLFVMISNHYAMAYGARHNWLVLIAICAAGVSIRVYFVDRHKRRLRGGKTSPWPALLGVLALAATAAALAPRAAPSTIPPAATPAAEFSAVQRIVVERCVPCHSASPTEPGFATAPQGLSARYTRGHPHARGRDRPPGAGESHADRESHGHDRRRAQPVT